MSKEWSEEWVNSVGRRVSVVVDPCECVEGVVVEVYPNVPAMRIQSDKGHVYNSHPRYARPVW